MGHQRQHLETPVVQAEEGADAHVVALRLHGPGDAVQPPEIIALERVAGMDAMVGFVVIGFLEDLIGADAGRLDRGIAGMVQRGGVEVHPANFALAGLDRIDLPHAIGHVMGVVLRMLAEDEDDALVAAVFQGFDLGAQVGRRERAADILGVGTAEAAVLTIVGALVADIQRREQDDAVAVDVAFQLPGGREDLLHAGRVVGGQQHGGLFDAERFLGHALGDHVAEPARRRLLPQQPKQLRLVDEIVSAAAQSRPVNGCGHRLAHGGEEQPAARKRGESPRPAPTLRPTLRMRASVQSRQMPAVSPTHALLG